MSDIQDHTGVRYSSNLELDFSKLDDLLEAVGWGRRGLRTWATIIARSSGLVSAWHENTIVGFGRVMHDGVMCMFYDIAVHPSYQNKGIGTRIMEELLASVADQNFASIGLFAWDKNPASIRFYRKFGFELVSNGMKLKRG